MARKSKGRLPEGRYAPMPMALLTDERLEDRHRVYWCWVWVNQLKKGWAYFGPRRAAGWMGCSVDTVKRLRWWLWETGWLDVFDPGPGKTWWQKARLVPVTRDRGCTGAPGSRGLGAPPPGAPGHPYRRTKDKGASAEAAAGATARSHTERKEEAAAAPPAPPTPAAAASSERAND